VQKHLLKHPLFKHNLMANYWLLFLLFITVTSFTQTGKYPVVKLYAYEQKVSGGANFSSDTKGRAAQRHFVYLLVRNDRAIDIETVWINGREVKQTTEPVQSPVNLEKSIKLGNQSSFETLVPTTTHKVMQIVIGSEPEDDTRTAPSRYSQYPLLIAYKEEGKLYYLGAKSWQKLSPQVNQ
jgi:hypothetical protein